MVERHRTERADIFRGAWVGKGELLNALRSVTAAHQAQGALWGALLQQASILSYNDVFRFLGWMFILMLPLLLLMEKPKGKGPAMAH